MPNLTDELSTARERCQFGTVVLVWCGNSVKFDRCCRTFAELKLGSTHGALSESDVAPVSLQSNLLNKNALTAASSFACLEIRSRNEEAINSTRNRIYSLKVFLLPTLSTSSILKDIDLVGVLDTTGNSLWSQAIGVYKSREITSLPEIKKVIYMASHFNHRRK